MDNKIIKKSNSFVEGQYDVTLWEKRVILKMLSLIKKEDEDFHEYTIDLKEFKKDFGLNNDGSAYKRIREAADSLMTKIIVIRNELKDGTIEEVKVNMVADYTRNLDKSTYIKMSFHPKMRPYLLQLQSEFLRYNVKNILKLPTSYSIRIYELTKQYQKIGKRTISLEELRRILKIENKYKQYAHLRQRIIDPCLEAINLHTDIHVTYIEIKQGRKVVKIKFTIKSKADKKEIEPVNENELVIEFEKDEFLNELVSWGIKKELLINWRNKYGDNYIRERVQYVKNQEGVTNPGGYLNLMMNQDIPKKDTMPFEAKLRKVKGMLYSREGLEQQIINKHGNVSDKVLVSIMVKMFPDKFKNR